MSGLGLRKCERLCSFHTIEKMFNREGTASLFSYPVRMLYMSCEDGNMVLISVPKRLFKHAVDRNRIKRQVREAYRHNKAIIEHQSLAMAFIWTADKMVETHVVDSVIKGLLKEIEK
ncbi:MAG: ribonuclease P protein component [Prevotella sp.]|nr:ribonuclease P protein component [Candidatus Equicola faecalis]MDO4819035.1 ribonuclease P protein component [Prevotella sp.]